MASQPSSSSKGLWAERRALIALERHGWRLLAQQWRCRWGEIDVNLPQGHKCVKLLATSGSPINTPTKPTAISYARVSSGKQKRDGDGLQRQIEAAAHWAATHGFTLDPRDSFADAGFSASKGQHLERGAALHQILEAAAAGALGPNPVLLIEDVTRLSRLEPLDGLERVFLPLVRAGVRIVLVEDGTSVDAQTLNTDQMALVMLVLKIQAAAAYSRKLKTYGLAHRAKNRAAILDGQPVCPGWAPSWIEMVDGQWQFSAFAPTVKRLLDLMLEHGSHVTAATLNAEGYLTPTGKGWDQTNVLRLLENPALWGARRIADPDHATRVQEWRRSVAAWELAGKQGPKPLKPRRTYQAVPDTYPALMNRKEYDQLMAVIAKRVRSPKEKGRRDQIRYIGQTLTKCRCGAPIGVRHVNPNGPRPLSYLFCRGRERKITTCTRKMIRLEKVQHHLLSRLQLKYLVALVEGDAQAAQSRAAALIAQRGVLEATLTGQEQQLANATAALKAAIKAGHSLDVFAETIDEVRSAITETKNQISAVLADLAAIQGEGLTEQLDGAVRKLMLQFAKDAATVEQRRAVNKLLQRLEVQITLDTATQELALQVGDGDPQWKPLAPIARKAGLVYGIADPDCVHEIVGGGYVVMDWDAGRGVSHNPVESEMTEEERLARGNAEAAERENSDYFFLPGGYD